MRLSSLARQALQDHELACGVVSAAREGKRSPGAIRSAQQAGYVDDYYPTDLHRWHLSVPSPAACRPSRREPGCCRRSRVWTGQRDRVPGRRGWHGLGADLSTAALARARTAIRMGCSSAPTSPGCPFRPARPTCCSAAAASTGCPDRCYGRFRVVTDCYGIIPVRVTIAGGGSGQLPSSGRRGSP